MPLPAASFLLPLFNGSAFVHRALSSLAAQTVTCFEVVVVDDGSTDASARIVEEWADRDQRIRLVRRPHEGIVGALEAGLAHCRAPVIVRMDADDRAHPQRLAKILDAFEVNSHVDVVASQVAFEGDRRRAAGYARYVDWTNRLLTHEDMALYRFVEAPLAHPAAAFRRRAVDRFGSYRPGDFPEDYELWLRWFHRGARFHKIAAPLLTWRDRPRRLSRSSPRYRPEAFYRIKAHYLARWLAAHNPHHPDVVVWGAGRTTRRRAEVLVEEGVSIRAYIDIDPKKIGRIVHGRPVLAPHEVPPPDEAFVLGYVASHGARDDIAARLEARGYELGRSYMPAA